MHHKLKICTILKFEYNEVEQKMQILEKTRTLNVTKIILFE